MVTDSLLLKAGQGKLDITEIMSEAEKLGASGQKDQVITLYRKWIENTKSPFVYAACFNLGVALSDSGDMIAAEQAYRRAIVFKPDFIQARFNLGSILERQNRANEALDEWRGILALGDSGNSALLSAKSLHLMTLNNLGRLLEIIKQYRDAELMLEKSLTLEPEQPDAISHWVHLRQKQCQWPVYSHPAGLSMESMIKGTSAIAMLSATNDPQQQLDTATAFVANKVITGVDSLSSSSGYHHEKLRIGYISSDFRTHAVSLLTVELFELHDRSKFEIYGFCSTPEDDSLLRGRVIKAMDHFVRIAAMGDEDAARSIRQHEIDILVDLQGLTSGLRPNIFAYHPAPVQITYLGFPGTTGLPGIDYVLADKFLIPEESAPFFTEKPLYMPHVFQVSDRQREVGVKPSRSSCNLPDDAFVFCSFNNNYKITEEMFACWMRILKRVEILDNSPKSVLWLLADNKWAQENMIKAAVQHGVSEDRLIFASRVAPPDYLARYQVADLFLDTFPFNAGTTANDALWMGLPILTLSGRTFASRMAGSLISSLGLSELVTYNLQDYEDKAVSLASDWAGNRADNQTASLDNQSQNLKLDCQDEKLENRLTRIANLRHYIEDNRNFCHLFDMPGLVRDIEGLFEKVAVRQVAPSGQISVRPAVSITDEVALRPIPTDEENLNKAKAPEEMNKEPEKTRRFLHVGCGSTPKTRTTRAFSTDKWSEIRFDIDESVSPDIVGTMTDMSRVPDSSVDAIFSSHNIEHLYPHEVPTALSEFIRVLKNDGFAVITCPDLQSVCALIADNKLTEPAYQSPAGPITPLDILYGHIKSMEHGNLYMAHRGGFTKDSLTTALKSAGFATAGVMARPENFDLWAVASKKILTPEQFTELVQQQFT